MPPVCPLFSYPPFFPSIVGATVDDRVPEVYLVAQDEHGEQLLDQLQERTGVYPYKTTGAGERAYASTARAWTDSMRCSDDRRRLAPPPKPKHVANRSSLPSLTPGGEHDGGWVG